MKGTGGKSLLLKIKVLGGGVYNLSPSVTMLPQFSSEPVKVQNRFAAVAGHVGMHGTSR